MSLLLQLSGKLYACFETIAAGVKITTDCVKYIINLNYEFVASLLQISCQMYAGMAYVLMQAKSFFHMLFSFIGDILTDSFRFLGTVFTVIWRTLLLIHEFFHFCYIKISAFCLSLIYLLSVSCLTVKQGVMDTYDVLSSSVHYSVSLVVSAVTTMFIFVTTLGNVCVNFVMGVWHGLGYILSSVAYFPTYCSKRLEDAWTGALESLYKIFTSMTKETYLGIVCLCLVYLTLSNTFRYLSYRRLSFLPHRLSIGRRRRRQTELFNWDFDPGFESDFEDVYGSDTDERVWRRRHQVDEDTDENSEDEDTVGGEEDDDNSDESSNDSSSSNGNDSDEYTVVTEESDSEGSVNSQTFSTESSEHEIEVQLPSVDERYSLRSRSSTPSRGPKLPSSPEDFDREMERERDKRKCVVCQDQIKSVLVLPCRHMCMCVVCADQIVCSRIIGRRKVCPLCRTKIQKVMNVYV